MKSAPRPISRFDEIYDQYFYRILIFVQNRISQPQEAEDLVQEIFIKIFQRKSQLHLIQDMDRYIYTVAKNSIIDYYRSSLFQQKKNVSTHSIDQVEDPSLSLIPASDVIQGQTQQLYQFINDLPDQQKKIFILKKIEGKTTAEIANEFSISKRTVENQVYKAMLNLRNKFSSFFL